MKKLVVVSLVVVLLAPVLSYATLIETTRVNTVGAKDGCLNTALSVGGTTVDNTGTTIYVGDRYTAGLNVDYGVFKFALPTDVQTATSINSASLGVYVSALGPSANYPSYGGVYLKIQRYTNDNTGNVSVADSPITASLATVAVVLLSANNAYYNWDITSAIAADVAAGHTYSSFLLSVVNSAGNQIDSSFGTYCFRITSREGGWGVFPTHNSYPHLDINYTIPEPATVALLLGGSIMMAVRGKRKHA